MFKAIVVFCVIQAQGMPPRCLPLEDTYGPFKTEENCNIRVDQMVRDILEDKELSEGIVFILGGSQIYYSKQCIEEPSA